MCSKSEIEQTLGVEGAIMFKRSLVVLVGCSALAGAAGQVLAATGAEMVFSNFENGVPTNREGQTYPSAYASGNEGGPLAISIDSSNRKAGGSSLKLVLTGGKELYAQWNPYDGVGRDFARNYSTNPSAWRFNTYNRFRFWFYVPPTATAERTDGNQNFYMGTYVKRVTAPDIYSDETGGGHFYHPFNVLRGEWSLCVLNTHPGHERGVTGGTDSENRPYPTSGDPANTYNYFDALTRFYIQENSVIPNFPREYRIDDMVFFQETAAENDRQIYSICASLTSSNRLFLTWNRHKDENSVRNEVRYAFSDIHSIGWNAATPAPGGTITPPGYQGYNGMIYDTTGINLSGRSVVYLAIKPENSSVFSQIALPVSGAGAPPPAKTPNPPSGLSAR
jgi:hypothetical protein